MYLLCISARMGLSKQQIKDHIASVSKNLQSEAEVYISLCTHTSSEALYLHMPHRASCMYGSNFLYLAQSLQLQHIIYREYSVDLNLPNCALEWRNMRLLQGVCILATCGKLYELTVYYVQILGEVSCPEWQRLQVCNQGLYSYGHMTQHPSGHKSGWDGSMKLLLTT